MSADATVVFPIPISPSATTPAPSAASRRPSSAPRTSPWTATVRSMAGPSVAFAVPRPSERSSTPDTEGEAATPASTTTSRADASRHRTATAAPPRSNAASICPVTSCGYALTPSAATPWSPAATTTTGSSGAGRTSPRTVAIRTASSSSRPRLPLGLVFASRASRAACSTAGCRGRTARTTSSSSVVTRAPGESEAAPAPAPAARAAPRGRTRRGGMRRPRSG